MSLKKLSRWLFRAGLLILALTSLGLLLFALPVQAAPAPQGEKPGNDFCLACHQKEGIDKTLGNEQLLVAINPTEYKFSVHAVEGVLCVDCHSDISDYPHPDVKADSIREFSLSFSENCKGCHEEQYLKQHDSMHQKALDEGNQNAPICADCHNPHTQPRIIGQSSGKLSIAARKEVPQTCSQCHGEIYAAYQTSAHGSALADGNTDVPTCTDCHGVHNINDPRTDSFRNNTPQLCINCHDDDALMKKYGLSTNVKESYVADFHGSTVMLFEQQFPGQPTNKAVCTDCHGVHDIVRASDPNVGIALRENLLVKCQRCHPDATANFPDAWMSHYEPSPEHFPIVYYVNLFYKFFIPLVLGGMTLFVLTDIYRRIINRVKGAKHS
ncbi:MAG: hypothetical protein Fur002_13210 [Anaerolineales bacterium]